jgi:hypothetical protein
VKKNIIIVLQHIRCESLNAAKNHLKCGDVKMSNEMSKKVPMALLGIFIAIAIVLIVSISIQETSTETVIPTQPPNSQHINTSGDESDSRYLSSTSYSGPFAILDDSYGVDDTVFFIGSDISLDSKGDIFFVRPDGEVHHTLYFDGSQQAVNHYFMPVSSSDLKECPDCEFFGTWEIAFRPIDGNFYSSMYFEVEDDR